MRITCLPLGTLGASTRFLMIIHTILLSASVGFNIVRPTRGSNINSHVHIWYWRCCIPSNSSLYKWNLPRFYTRLYDFWGHCIYWFGYIVFILGRWLFDIPYECICTTQCMHSVYDHCVFFEGISVVFAAKGTGRGEIFLIFSGFLVFLVPYHSNYYVMRTAFYTYQVQLCITFHSYTFFIMIFETIWW